MEVGGLASPGAALAPIDWDPPWLDSLRGLRPLLQAGDWRLALSEEAGRRGVRSGEGRAIEFVAADAAGKAPYELFIAQTGRVPTRENQHDLFNALIWLEYPRAKAALNARQAAEIRRSGVGPVRGAVRDAATLIDESALLLLSNDARVITALREHDWQRLLIDWRARWGRDIITLAFGHALLEKLAGPFKAITAAVVPLPGTSGADGAAADFIARADLAPALLPHLPVLGIPGWWAANADPRFYADPLVFRPRRDAKRMDADHAD
jgi:hypothetical protein